MNCDVHYFTYVLSQHKPWFKEATIWINVYIYIIYIDVCVLTYISFICPYTRTYLLICSITQLPHGGKKCDIGPMTLMAACAVFFFGTTRIVKTSQNPPLNGFSTKWNLQTCPPPGCSRFQVYLWRWNPAMKWCQCIVCTIYTTVIIIYSMRW